MTAFRSVGFTPFEPPWRSGVGDTEADAPPRRPGYASAENGAPPSSYAVLDVINGQPGSILRLITLTALRGAFIIPGVWVVSKIVKVDLDTKQLMAFSFGASATITAGMIGLYWLRSRT